MIAAVRRPFYGLRAAQNPAYRLARQNSFIFLGLSGRASQDETWGDREGARTIVCDDDPVFVLYRVASRYGLPLVPEWAPWFMRGQSAEGDRGLDWTRMLTRAGERE